MATEYKIVGGLKLCLNGEVVAESDYNGDAFADPYMEITKEDIAMGYKAAGDEIVKAWHDFKGYLKRHPEAWQALADKLWDGFVDYKDVPFGDKEVWHE